MPGTIYFEPQITVEDAALKVTNVFTYLGSKIANDGQLDAEINCCIVKASASFGKLHSRVWSSHDLKLNTKVEVYNIVVLSTLLRRGLFTSDTSRSSRPPTNHACVPYVASNGKTWSQILKYFRDAVSLSTFRLPDLREAGERSRWRTLLHQGSRIAENDHSEGITEKRIRRKNPDAARDRGHNCTDCGKRCASAAGLAAHRRWKH